jgi:hypothetical protein
MWITRIAAGLAPLAENEARRRPNGIASVLARLAER